jgi:hypothetical protein
LSSDDFYLCGFASGKNCMIPLILKSKYKLYIP